MAILYSAHVLKRMFQRGLTLQTVARALEQGDTVVITAYVPEAALWDETFKRKLP